MPNIESALRRVKRSEAQASVNKIRKSKYKAAVKQMTSFITAGKTKEELYKRAKLYKTQARRGQSLSSQSAASQ